MAAHNTTALNSADALQRLVAFNQRTDSVMASLGSLVLLIAAALLTSVMVDLVIGGRSRSSRPGQAPLGL